MKDLFEPALWNRSIMAWIWLSLSITFSILGITNLDKIYFLIGYFFLSGFAFSFWFWESSINNLKKITRNSFKLNETLLKEIDKLSNKYIQINKQKGKNTTKNGTQRNTNR